MENKAIMRAIYNSCRVRHGRARIRESLEEFVDAHEVEEPDRSALVQAGAKPLLTYRRMIQGRLGKCIRWRLPRTCARLENRFNTEVAAFLNEHTIRTPYLREVPVEFVAWATPRWNADPEIPEYLADLASHELLDIEVTNALGGGEPPTGEPVEPGRGIAFDGTARLRHYEHAVQRLSLDKTDLRAPEPETSHVLAYRDAEMKARYMELTPLGNALMTALLEDGATLGEAVGRVAEALGEPVSDDMLKRIALLLADMGERGVARGGGPLPAG